MNQAFGRNSSKIGVCSSSRSLDSSEGDICSPPPKRVNVERKPEEEDDSISTYLTPKKEGKKKKKKKKKRGESSGVKKIARTLKNLTSPKTNKRKKRTISVISQFGDFYGPKKSFGPWSFLCFFCKCGCIPPVPTRIKKMISCGCCCCVSFSFNLIALALTVSLSIHYFTQTTVVLTNRKSTVSEEIERMYELKKGVFESRTLSVLGFYYGSSFVDYEEYLEYCRIAGIITAGTEESTLNSVSWYTTVPYHADWKYNSYISTNKFKLPEAELTLLNETQPTVDDEFLHVLTYTNPSKSVIGEKFTETSISDTLFSDYVNEEDNQESRVTYDHLLYIDGQLILEFLSPVMKSDNLSEALVDYQGGFISYQTDPLEIIDYATGHYSDIIDHVVYLRIGTDDNDDVCLYGCDSSQNLDEKYASSWEIQFSDRLYEDHVDSKSLMVYLLPKSGFFVTEYQFSVYLAMFLPFAISLVITLLTCFVCLYYINHVKVVDQLQVFERVSSEIALMKFESKNVKKIMNKKSPRRIERMLKQIVIVLKEYKTYMPQTLLERLSGELLQGVEVDEGLHDDDDDLSSGYNSTSSTVSSISSTFSSPIGSFKKKKKQRGGGVVGGGRNKFGMLRQRNVLVMIVGVSNLDEIRRSVTGGRLIEILGKFHSSVHQIMKKYHANFHQFRGFRMMYTFGAVSVRVSPGADAIRAAWEVTNHQELTKMDLEVSAGIGKVHCFCGDLSVFDPKDGSVLLRQFDCISVDPGQSFTIDTVVTLQRLNKRYGTKIIIESELHAHVKFRSDCKLLDVVEFKEGGFSRVKKIYEVHRVPMNVKVDEWMYEIDNAKGETKECFEAIEKCWKSVLRGNLGKSVELMEVFLSIGENRRMFGEHFWRLKEVIKMLYEMDEEERSDYKTVLHMI